MSLSVVGRLSLESSCSHGLQQQFCIPAQAQRGDRIGHRAQLRMGDQSEPLFGVHHIHTILKDTVSHLYKSASSFTQSMKIVMMQAGIDAFYKESDKGNSYFAGNFAPVNEIGKRVQVKVINGAIPEDFPNGVYIRNGPNPQFGGRLHTSSLFGTTFLHWFEGDGMLHATYFGPRDQVSYQNKYVETEGYIEERRRGKPLWLNSVEGDSKAIIIGIFFNKVQFGKANKATCNTSILAHAGRLFANAEGDIPHEIDPFTLSTLNVWDVGEQWGRPFTSHPKVMMKMCSLACKSI